MLESALCLNWSWFSQECIHTQKRLWWQCSEMLTMYIHVYNSTTPRVGVSECPPLCVARRSLSRLSDLLASLCRREQPEAANGTAANCNHFKTWAAEKWMTFFQNQNVSAYTEIFPPNSSRSWCRLKTNASFTSWGRTVELATLRKRFSVAAKSGKEGPDVWRSSSCRYNIPLEGFISTAEVMIATAFEWSCSTCVCVCVCVMVAQSSHRILVRNCYIRSGSPLPPKPNAKAVQRPEVRCGVCFFSYLLSETGVSPGVEIPHFQSHGCLQRLLVEIICPGIVPCPDFQANPAQFHGDKFGHHCVNVAKDGSSQIHVAWPTETDAHDNHMQSHAWSSCTSSLFKSSPGQVNVWFLS